VETMSKRKGQRGGKWEILDGIEALEVRSSLQTTATCASKAPVQIVKDLNHVEIFLLARPIAVS